MCCATRWRSTHSTSAACISAPPAGRCTRRLMPETAGLRLCAIFRRCCRWRCRRWHESRRYDHTDRINTKMIRVILPQHLRTLAHVGSEVTVEVEGPVTQRSVLDAIEARYPMLRGTIRDHVTQQRRPFLRFFACEEDLSHESPDAPLPEAVVAGKEPLLIVGAIAGG